MNSPGSGLVSTIIPVYNRAGLLVEAVSSVLGQTHRPIEVIVVDDGSTDDTATVATELALRYPGVVRSIRRANGNWARAVNDGLRIATGEFIQILDSDDLVMPEKFATQVHALQTHPDCGLSYCYAREYAIGDPPPARPARRTSESFEQLLPGLMSGRIWPGPSPLYRRAVFDTAGLFRELLTYPDWEFECRLAAAGVRVHHCRLFLADVRNTSRLEGRGRGGSLQSIRDGAEAHALILGHARRAGVAAPALDVFSRRLFAVGRQCAAAGLETEARQCLRLGQSAVGTASRRRQMALFSAAADLLGWQTIGRWCEGAQHRRRRAEAPWRRFATRWHHRVSAGFTAVIGEPLIKWPRLLARLWSNRSSRQHLNSW
ncbi:MAG: glycosyltransferase family 2 protein [Vicinamibacterales bacterium]